MKILFNRNNGFTLIEIIVVIAITTILIFLFSALLVKVLKDPNQQMKAMENIYKSRNVVSDFSNEMRNCVFAQDGSYPISKATDNEIIFFSNYKAGEGNVKRIRYYISNGVLYKGVVFASGNPPIYNIASEVVTQVASSITNNLQPIFYYYDGNYDGTGQHLQQPVNINNIRYINISLNVLKETTKGSTSEFTIIGGSTIRPLKDNLND